MEEKEVIIPPKLLPRLVEGPGGPGDPTILSSSLVPYAATSVMKERYMDRTDMGVCNTAVRSDLKQQK